MAEDKTKKRQKKGKFTDKESKLEEKISEMRKVSLEKEALGKAAFMGMKYINLKDFPIEGKALMLIPKDVCEEKKVVAFFVGDNMVRVGVVNPESPDVKEISDKYLKKKGYKVSLFVISKTSFDWAMKRYKFEGDKKEDTGPKVTKEELEEAEKQIRSLSDLKDRILRVPVTKVIDVIMAGAVVTGASDIHLEPTSDDVLMRYRIDGVLQNIMKMPTDFYKKVLSRIKILSGMKINISDIPQDGRFAVVVGDKEVDLRISTLPTAYSEKVVMRLLGVGATGLSMEKLGFSRRDLEIIKEGLSKSYGMVLTTGPTGSGKTTSLYSFLQKVKNPEVNIITLENPIEYRLDGITQTQINEKAGMTFSSGLRAVLRQDPDIVMIGEIRDEDTAEIAVQAANTGHLVLSTLHTNDSSGVIPRIIDMGVRPYSLAPALNAVIAQRLVRRLCPKCIDEYKPDEKILNAFKDKLGDYYPKKGVKKLFKAKGCALCGNTGYKGRIGIYEVFKVDKEIRDLIGKRASSVEIYDLAIKKGMITMEQDGLLKAIEGVTSFEEVERVI